MSKPQPRIVAYYRVSTKRQGKSGLGLEAQRQAVLDHAKCVGAVLVAEFTEIESGRVCERPTLDMAMRLARREKATLVVAKLDRLARNVAFLSSLMEAKVDFVACDYPMANKFMLHMLIAVAENEVDMIRTRITIALKVAKARGVKLGSHRPGHWNGHERARIEGARRGARISTELRKAKAKDDYLDLMPRILELRRNGHSLDSIANVLTAANEPTARGGKWRAVTIQMLLRRYGEETSTHIDSPLTPR